MPAMPIILPSVLRARVKPEYFQAIPIIIEAEPDIGVNFLAGTVSEQLSTKIGKTIPSMNMFSMILPRDMLGDLAAIEGVRSISLDRTHFALEVPAMGLHQTIRATMEGIIPTSEAIKRVNVPALHRENITGRGVNVAVLDTGIDLTNPQIAGGAAKMSTIKAQPTGDDENGHGSWCGTCIKGKPFRDSLTGLLATGVAPDCNLTSIKVLGFGIGTGMTSDIMEAMELAVAQGNEIISMSLGSEGSEDEDLDPMVRMINQYAETHPKVIFVVANGNSGPGPRTVGIPAVAEKAVSVGSWGIIDNDIAYFSSRGPTVQAARIKPDICGCGGGRHQEGTKPEENLWSGTAFGSMLDPIVDRVENGFTAIKGTSMATPQVAGILALWKQMFPELTTDVAKGIFQSMSGRVKDPNIGWGLIDATWILSASESPQAQPSKIAQTSATPRF